VLSRLPAEMRRGARLDRPNVRKRLKSVQTSFNHADGEALGLRNQLFSDMGVKLFLDPRIIVVAHNDCVATIFTGSSDDLGD